MARKVSGRREKRLRLQVSRNLRIDEHAAQFTKLKANEITIAEEEVEATFP